MRQTDADARRVGKTGWQVPSRQAAKDSKVDKSQLERNSETYGAYPYPGGAQATLCLGQAASCILIVLPVTNPSDCPAQGSQHVTG